MANRKRHTHKEIEKVVAYAESLDWRVVAGTGHAWAYLYCPRADRSGCKVGVWSTPKNPENHVRGTFADRWTHARTAQFGYAGPENE